MSPKPDVSAERKQQIHQAAITCFVRKGYHLTTMDDIVAESGLSKGALYWYFKGKKELFLSLFQEMLEEFGRTWEPIVTGGESSATEKLLDSMAFFRSLEEMVPYIGILLEAWALIRHDEDVESLVREFYQPFLDLMTGIIEEGIAKGEFEVEVPEATALVVMTLFDGVMLALGTGLVPGLGKFDWDRLMDAAEALVLHGLGAKRLHGD